MSNSPAAYPTSIRLVIDMPYIYKDITIPEGVSRKEYVSNYLEAHAQEIAQDYINEIEQESWFLREMEFENGIVDVADEDAYDPYAGQYDQYTGSYFAYC